jgi:potassium efflux system protein
MRYYLMSIGLIVPLIMALIMFDNLNDREFSGSLGRLCFMLICGALAIVTLSLKRAGIPLYLDKTGSGDNMFNRLLWNLLLSAPLIAMLAAAWLSGHVAGAAGASGNLGRHLVPAAGGVSRHPPLDADPAPPSGVRPRQASPGGDPRPARAGEEEPNHVNSTEGTMEADEVELDLDAISTQSLRLVRSILMLIPAVGHLPVVGDPLRIWLPGEHLAVGRDLHGAGR